MSNVTWGIPGTNGLWGTGTNWTGLSGETFPGQVPGNADAVTIGAGGSAYTVTFNVATAGIGSLSLVGGTGSRSTTLQMTSGDALTISGNLSLGNNTILDGAGTVSVGGTVSGSGTIQAGTSLAGGTLDITGTGTLSSGITFSIGTTAATTLEIDLAGGATAAALSITSANQTLEVGPSGNLTLTGTQTVTNGNILMAGGKLADTSGIKFASGALSGSGTVTANLSKSSGTDTITASGGTLDLTGTFGSGLTAAISSASASDLKFDSTASLSAPISITSNNQTLEVGSSGAATITGAQNVTLGTIKLDGGSISDSSGISFGTGTSNGTLSGFGTVTGVLTRTGTGTADTITATGGTLTLATAIGASSGLVFDIGNTATSVLKLSAAPSTGNTFTFLGSAGDLALSSSATFNDGVAGLNVGTSLTPTNFVDILGSSVTVSSGKSGTGTSGTVKLSNGAQLNLTGITNTSGTWFVNTKSDGAGGTDIFLSTVCFAAGTRILTCTGERSVESLLHGDIVLTLSGDELSARPVKWIGRRRIDITAYQRPEKVAPIRIRRGAFADNTPHTDLLVSPDHAIFVEGKLVCARQLVNGTTILQELGWTSVDYYHVELDAHAILLAEGLPTESYLDTGNRGFFGNSDEPLILHPDLTDESDYPAREAGSCAPFVSDEADVLPVWKQLAERAAALGQPVPKLETTTDPALRLVAKGRTVKPIYIDSKLAIFAVPRGATEVRLVSRFQAPTTVRPWLEDQRLLGVRVSRIILRSAHDLREIPVDHPDIAKGWWAVERDDSILCRWTNGDAALRLPELDGTAMLEVHFGGSMIYTVDAVSDPVRRAA